MSDDLQKKLAEIQQRYAGKMQAKHDEIAKMLKDYRMGKIGEDELYPPVHTLAGSAETFGFTEIGAKARIAEEKIDNKADKKEVISLVEELLSTMQASI